MRNIVCLILSVFTTCCASESIKKNEYYKSGEIKFESFFKTESDSLPFLQISFNKDGTVKDSCRYNENGNLEGVVYSAHDEYEKWSHWKNGIREGKSTVKFYSGKQITQHFSKNKLHGVEYRTNLNKRTIEEVVWENDVPILMNEIHYLSPGDTLLNFIRVGNESKREVKIVQDTMQVNSYFKIEGQDRYPMGSLNFDKDLNIINTYNNSYVTVDICDTISNGEQLSISIKGYFGNFKDTYLDCWIADSKDKLRSYNQLKCYSSVEGDSNLDIKVLKYKLGYNMFIGKIQLKRNTSVLHEVLFYGDFYVLK